MLLQTLKLRPLINESGVWLFVVKHSLEISGAYSYRLLCLVLLLLLVGVGGGDAQQQ
jgi:hypothetical protein